LSPIKKIKINEFYINYDIQKIDFQAINNIYQNYKNTFIPIIEINLPFLTTSYIYIKYILLMAIYLYIPIILYFIYISVSNIFKKNEIFNIKFILFQIILFMILNFIITHYMIIPLFINFIYSHYNEFLYYEFDVEFQLINYLNLYFQVLFINFVLFITNIIKKYLKLNINTIIIYLLFLLILPFDGILQIIYIFIFFIFNCINLIAYNYYKRIKKYKQKEHLEIS
jgi:Sec-independent protein secretion pathway component TatC